MTILNIVRAAAFGAAFFMAASALAQGFTTKSSSVTISNAPTVNAGTGFIAGGAAGDCGVAGNVLCVQGAPGGLPIGATTASGAVVLTSAVTSATDVAIIDNSPHYATLFVQPVQYGGGSVRVQGSNDGGTTWLDAVGVVSSGSQSSSLFNGLTTSFRAEFSKLKIVVTSYSSGTFQFYYQLTNDGGRSLSQFALLGGEAQLGMTGQNTFTQVAAPATTVANYAAGNSIGGKITLANMARVSAAIGSGGTGGRIQSVLLTYVSALSAINNDVVFFKADPTASTCTNNAAFVLAAADMDKVVGVARVIDTVPGGTGASVAQIHDAGIRYAIASGTTLYACVVARTATNVGSTTDLKLAVTTERN